MVSTKQFTIFFLLVVVFLAAISIVTSLAWREAETVYDTVSLHNTMVRIVEVSADKIQGQEDAMQMWVDEATLEVQLAILEIEFFMNQSDALIHDTTPPPVRALLDPGNVLQE